MYGKAAWHQCREGSHIFLRIVMVFLGLSQAHYAGYRKRGITIAGGLAAPWSSVCHNNVILYTQRGIVIVQEFTSLETLPPQGRMGALASTALAHEQKGLALPHHC